MESEVTNRPANLDDCGVFDICGGPANTLTYDATVIVRIDDSSAKMEHRIVRHFCTDHGRAGTLAFRRESGSAYLARIAAEEGDL